MSTTSPNLTLELYKGYAFDELDRWDAILHPQVMANSPGGRDIVGLTAFKQWNKAFIDAFRPRTDLIDHYVVGNRGLVMINLHWKHDGGPFAGIPATGRSGTSVEAFMLRIDKGLVTRVDIADASLDLANYLHDQGMKLPRLVEPPALVRG